MSGSPTFTEESLVRLSWGLLDVPARTEDLRTLDAGTSLADLPVSDNAVSLVGESKMEDARVELEPLLSVKPAGIGSGVPPTFGKLEHDACLSKVAVSLFPFVDIILSYFILVFFSFY